jgi:glycosyltransferase involved in cell wall biosynthesis
MRIGVDARFLVAERTGVETYFQEILERLILLGGEEEYFLYGSHGMAPRLPPGKWQCVESRRLAFPPGSPRPRPEDRLDLFYSPVTAFPSSGAPRRVVTVHDLSWHHVPDSYSPLERFRHRRWVSRAVAEADRVVVVSEATRRDLAAAFPASETKSVVIPPGVEERFFAEWGRRDEQRVRDRYSLQGRYLLTLGSFHPRKNLPDLVEAYDRLRSRSAERMTLLIAGRGGRDSGRLVDRILRSPYRGDILMAGYVPREDLPALYAGADLLVFPSRYEGFGIPALEAMAVGTPVLVSDLPVFEEVCADAALRFRPGDPDSLAEGMAASLREEPGRLERVRRGAERARRFRWEDSARRLRDLFREVMEGSRE